MQKHEEFYETVENCRFCYSQIKHKIVKEVRSIVAIKDEFPVSDGHYLLIPKKHSDNFFELSIDEKADLDQLIVILRDYLLTEDQSITGFNIGANCGKSAGQTIFHTHIHLIPRRNGDTPNPLGGVRGVIPEKMRYRVD